MRRALFAGTILVMGAIVACADLNITTAVDSIQVPLDSASFKRDIYPVLKATCATSNGCHFGPNAPNQAVQLDMSTDSAAYVNLVGVTSQARNIVKRVNPFKADSSFLYLVLRDTASIRLDYYRMPPATYVMPYPTRETIKNWINKGALNN